MPSSLVISMATLVGTTAVRILEKIVSIKRKVLTHDYQYLHGPFCLLVMLSVPACQIQAQREEC